MKAWHYAALPLFWLLRRFLAWMPEWMRERMGGLFGWLIRASLKRRWRITDSNLRICFPELSTEEREALAREHFRNFALVLIDFLILPMRSSIFWHQRLTIRGMEHLDQVKAEGRGALLLPPHFLSIASGGCLFAPHAPMDVGYFGKSSAFMERIFYKTLNQYFDWGLMRRTRQRHLLVSLYRRLKQGHAAIVLSDQHRPVAKGEISVYSEFFGVRVPSNPVAAWMALKSGASILPVSSLRHYGSRHEWIIHPPLDSQLTGDIDQDIQVINHSMEQLIRQHPDQYLWSHRRFRSLEGGRDIYAPQEARLPSQTGGP